MNRQRRQERPDPVAVQAERIIRQEWLDAGVSAEELERGRRVADLLDRLLADGCQVDALLEEWQGKSAEEILAEYATVEGSAAVPASVAVAG